MTDFDYLLRRDSESLFARRSLKAIRVNRHSIDSKVVILRSFVGASRQREQFEKAISQAAKELLAEHGVTLNYTIIDNNHVKNELKWSVTKLFDWLLEADIHLVPCHVHQGSLGKTSSWNMENIRSNATRLKHHLGLPMGKHVDCAVWQLDKYVIYKKTEEFSTPTMKIELEPGILSLPSKLEEIQR